MKALFVTTSIPFPPRQGVELPNAYIMEALSKEMSLDLLVISRNETEIQQFDQRSCNIPSTIQKIHHLHCQEPSIRKRLFQELTFQRPAFFIQGYEPQKLRELFLSSSYNMAWFSPVGTLGLLKECQKLELDIAPCIALGCNDVITTTYLDSLIEWASGRIGFSLQRLAQGLRTLIIWPLEKQYLQDIHLLHLQTHLEKKRAQFILGKQASQPVVIAAQNGRKEELEQVKYDPQDSNKNVLYMTQFKGGRSREAQWFLQKVWPRVVQKHPNAKLLLAGSPPEPDSEASRTLPKEAQVLGYVDDLVELYQSVRLAVIPTIHSTGLINRALDAFTAGVPLVATSAVLSTVEGCQPGKNAIAADSVTDFANAVCHLLEDSETCNRYSQAGRSLAMKQPTWSNSTDALVKAVSKICQLSHEA